MSKVNLIPQIISSLQETESQERKYHIVKKYEKESLFKRIILFAYNPWINFKLQHFQPQHMGKRFGMGMAKFMHMFDEIIEGKLEPKDAEFGFKMAFLHVNTEEAPILLSLIKQTLSSELGLEIETINKVWPDSISDYPLRIAKPGKYKDFGKFPAAIQTVSKGLRVNIIVADGKVQYRQKDGTVINGWNMWDDQFVNLAQGQGTVFDGHAVIAEDNKIAETDNQKVLEEEPKNIRFIFWDVIRYDGFITGKDTRIGYNWRYNGLEHMMMLAIEKNKVPCYDILKAEMVGSQEQLNTAMKNYSKAVIKSLDDTWSNGESDGEIICQT